MNRPIHSWQLKFALPFCALLWILAYWVWLSVPIDKTSPVWPRFFQDLFWQVQLPIVAAVLAKKWAQAGIDAFVDHGTPSLRSLAIIAPWLVLSQVVMGTLLRQGIWGAVPHVLGAMIVGGFLLYYSTGVITPAPAGHPARLLAMTLLWLSLTQIMLGIAAYVIKFSSGVPATMAFSNLHFITGALTLATTFALSVILKRSAQSQEVSGLASTPTV